LQIKIGYLLPALFFTFALNIFLGAYKWRLVMALSDIRMSYREVLRIWLGLLGMTFFMPFQSGHILYALALKKAKNLGYVESFESAGYDKYLSLVGTFGLIAVGQFFLAPEHPLARPWILYGALAVLVFYLFDSLALRALSTIDFIRERSRLIKRDCGPAKKLYLLLVAMVYQSSDVITFYLACRCLGISFESFSPVAAFPVILLLTYIPVTFSGIGAREGLLALLLAGSLAYDQAIAVGLIIDFVEYVSPAVIGLIFLPPLIKKLAISSKENS
jgi:uncharacterized membrane protein YbhN (UPF0104 family)